VCCVCACVLLMVVELVSCQHFFFLVTGNLFCGWLFVLVFVFFLALNVCVCTSVCVCVCICVFILFFFSIDMLVYVLDVCVICVGCLCDLCW